MKYVYIVRDKERRIIYGVFNTNRKAEKYISNSEKFYITRLEVL